MITGRARQLAAIAPSNGDGVLRILYLQPGTEPDTRDLYVLPVDAAGEPGSETLLATGLDPATDLGCIHRLAPCSIGPDGWTMIYGPNGYVRVNTITGERMVVGSAFAFPYSSDSGQRQFKTESNGSDPSSPLTGTLSEPDGSSMTFEVSPYLGWGGTYYFFGEDFYYLTPQGDLMHIPPAGAPEKLASTVDGFTYWTTSGGILLVLNRATADQMTAQSSVFDLATRQETLLPFAATPGPMFGGGNASLSPDARWILHVDNDAATFDFLDWRAGTLVPEALPVQLDVYPNDNWRPGTDEFWVQLGSYGMPAIWVLSPDTAPLFVGNLSFSGVSTPSNSNQSVFTPDGAYWFSTMSGSDVMYPVVQIGAAGDPTGPRHDLAPTGMNVDRYWPLPDGRLLTTVYTKNADRSDMIAYDPRTNSGTMLGERGRVVEVGDTRFLALQHFESGAGDLTAIDVASGQQTTLAPEFATTGFVEPQGDDRAAPGTRVVYEFEARSPSPYDGIWVVNLP